MIKKGLYSGIKPIIVIFFGISHILPFFTTTALMILEKNIYISNQFYGSIIYFSLLSPTFAALILLHFFYSKKEKINYLHRIIDLDYITYKEYLLIFGLPFFIRIFAAIFALPFSSTYFQFYFSPEMTFSYAVLLLFFGPIPEELGWRGIALPKLMMEYGIKVLYILGPTKAYWQ